MKPLTSLSGFSAIKPSSLCTSEPSREVATTLQYFDTLKEFLTSLELFLVKYLKKTECFRKTNRLIYHLRKRVLKLWLNTCSLCCSLKLEEQVSTFVLDRQWTKKENGVHCSN